MRRRVAPLDVPRRCARTDTGGAIGRETLHAGMVASGAGLSLASPARRSTARRSMLLSGRRGPMGYFGIGNKHYRSQGPNNSGPRGLASASAPDLPIADLVGGAGQRIPGAGLSRSPRNGAWGNQTVAAGKIAGRGAARPWPRPLRRASTCSLTTQRLAAGRALPHERLDDSKPGVRLYSSPPARSRLSRRVSAPGRLGSARSRGAAAISCLVMLLT
jgi:hypothetical protein